MHIHSFFLETIDLDKAAVSNASNTASHSMKVCICSGPVDCHNNTVKVMPVL